MHRLLAALLAASACVGVAWAQTPPSAEGGPSLSLERALELAGAASPSLDAASANRRAAEAGRRVAALRPNPSVTVEAENVAGTGLYRGVDSLEATTSLTLPIELGGKRAARIAGADALAGRAIIDAAIAQADLRLTVTEAYAEAVAAERRLDIMLDQARIAANSLRAAQVRVQAGRASPIEVQRAEVTRINADAALERARRLADVARLALSRLIGGPTPETLDSGWFARLAAGHGQLPPGDGDSAGTLALAAAEADLAIADAEVRLVRSRRVPDLTVGAGARRLEATNDTAAVFSLSIPIPLFDNGGAALAQATAGRQRADARRRIALLDAEQAIARAQAETANAAVTAATASGPALQAAAEAARIARIGYREGKFGQLDLLDAERTLAETRVTAVDALLAYHIAQARLERLTARAPATQDN